MDANYKATESVCREIEKQSGLGRSDIDIGRSKKEAYTDAEHDAQNAAHAQGEGVKDVGAGGARGSALSAVGRAPHA